MKWSKAKKQVDELPTNWSSVVSSYEQNKPHNLKISGSGKYTKIRVNMKPIEGYELKLIVYREKDKSVKRAFYVLFNDEKNVAHERVL